MKYNIVSSGTSTSGTGATNASDRFAFSLNAGERIDFDLSTGVFEKARSMSYTVINVGIAISGSTSNLTSEYSGRWTEGDAGRPTLWTDADGGYHFSSQISDVTGSSRAQVTFTDHVVLVDGQFSVINNTSRKLTNGYVHVGKRGSHYLRFALYHAPSTSATGNLLFEHASPRKWRRENTTMLRCLMLPRNW